MSQDISEIPDDQLVERLISYSHRYGRGLAAGAMQNVSDLDKAHVVLYRSEVIRRLNELTAIKDLEKRRQLEAKKLVEEFRADLGKAEPE